MHVSLSLRPRRPRSLYRLCSATRRSSRRSRLWVSCTRNPTRRSSRSQSPPRAGTPSATTPPATAAAATTATSSSSAPPTSSTPSYPGPSCHGAPSIPSVWERATYDDIWSATNATSDAAPDATAYWGEATAR